MNVLTYREWSETCTSLHLVLQMMGKTKLAAMVPQPEWGHVVLLLEPDGFSTGLVSTESGEFEVRLSVESAEVHAVSSSGLRASFSLGEAASTSERYRRFQEMLDQIGHPLPIDPMPQEMSIATPFDKMVDRAPFDTESARKALRQFLFAHNALGRFSSAFRGKRTPPSLYWGTFDLTTTLFSGEPLPFDPTASIVERAAFDEELMEFGFWPGDERTDEPSFFALAYPFVDGEPPKRPAIRGARFDRDSGEFLLSLKEALRSDDPIDTVVRFCRDAFGSVMARRPWSRLDWFASPLLVPELARSQSGSPSPFGAHGDGRSDTAR